jgi:hypothetical protein
LSQFNISNLFAHTTADYKNNNNKMAMKRRSMKAASKGKAMKKGMKKSMKKRSMKKK